MLSVQCPIWNTVMVISDSDLNTDNCNFLERNFQGNYKHNPTESSKQQRSGIVGQYLARDAHRVQV